MANIGDIKIVIAQPIHRDGIVKLAETSYFPYEPRIVAVGQTWDEQAEEGWQTSADACINEQASHVAVNSQNEVIGFRLSRILDMEKLSPTDSIYEFVPEGAIRTYMDCVSQDWPKVLPKVGKVFQFVGICVHQDYGGRGIGLEMTKANLELGKDLGCGFAVVAASNWMSQRVFEKAGFVPVRTIVYEDYKDRNGRQILCMKDPKQKYGKFYVKRLH